MRIEHRHHPRYPFEQAVIVSLADKFVTQCRAQEISLGGMKIKHTDYCLDEGSIIRIDFIPTPFRRTVISTLRAMVIYTSKDTSGLMFADDLFVDDMRRIVH